MPMASVSRPRALHLGPSSWLTLHRNALFISDNMPGAIRFEKLQDTKWDTVQNKKVLLRAIVYNGSDLL